MPVDNHGVFSRDLRLEVAIDEAFQRYYCSPQEVCPLVVLRKPSYSNEKKKCLKKIYFSSIWKYSDKSGKWLSAVCELFENFTFLMPKIIQETLTLLFSLCFSVPNLDDSKCSSTYHPWRRPFLLLSGFQHRSSFGPFQLFWKITNR